MRFEFTLETECSLELYTWVGWGYKRLKTLNDDYITPHGK